MTHYGKTSRNAQWRTSHAPWRKADGEHGIVFIGAESRQLNRSDLVEMLKQLDLELGERRAK